MRSPGFDRRAAGAAAHPGSPRGDRRLPADHRRRVLYVINDLMVGGAQRVLLHQSAGLDPARFRVEVASFDFEPSAQLVPEFERRGIPVHRLRRPGEPPVAGLPRLDRLIRATRPDLIHTHLAAAGVLARVAARVRGVPRLATTLHNLSDWEEKRGSALRWLDRRTLGLADAVVTVSEAIRSAVIRVSPRLAERTVTVHNGVPLDHLRGARAEREAARAALGLDAGAFVAGSVARLDPRKGFDVLIEALAAAAPRRPDLAVLLVGDGPERARLVERISAHRLEARVRLVARRSEVRPMLAAMDLFVAPSRTEGLGMAIIEALAAGVPVLGSAVGGIPEVVEDGGCGLLLPPLDVAAWAEALVRLAGRPAELERWARAAPARAARFSTEASSAALDRLYARLLDLPEPARHAAAA